MKNRVISNFLWRLLERWGAQGVTLIVSIVLARILGPEVYGTLALVTVFTTILQVFIDSGLGTALIQKKNADQLDFSSVFWFNIIICVLLYLLMYVAAPWIAKFYNNTELTPVIRVLSLILIISGLKNIQQAYVSRNLLFKKFFFATLGGTVGAAVIGIAMAMHGFGIWALVCQFLFNALVDTIILWLTVKWRPTLRFSFRRFKELFNYGWKILASSLIDTFYNQMRSLIIGKFYTKEDLAYYNKGDQFPTYAVDSINSSMNSVLLPVLSEKQDDKIAIKNATRKVIKTSSYVIWPMMMGLCAVSDNFIFLLLGEEWLPATIYMRILCFDKALQPLQTTNLSVIKAVGRSDIHLRLEIIKKSIALAIVVISSFFGIKCIAIGSVIYAVIATMINSFPNRKLIDYSYRDQVKDIIPFMSMSIVMGLIVYMVGYFPGSKQMIFLIQIVTGILVYIALSKALKIEIYSSALEKLYKIIKKEL